MKSERRIFLTGATDHAAIFLAFVWMSFAPFAARGANFYSGTSPATVPWTNGIVPYEFTNTLTAAQQQTYLDGLREWQLAANVSYVPHTTQTHWILFTYNTNYIDNVSGTTNPQVVTVSSLSRAQVCHEMGHSFGFTHENIRTDQTNYLIVLSNNVTSGNLSFFQIDPNSVTNGPYDFESVMHLSWDFASTQPGVFATQQPKPPYFPRYHFRMGNLTISPGDRAALRFLYGAPAVPLTNVVITTTDSGPGSLRAALYYVTDHPGVAVRFNIPTSDAGYSNGVFNIHLTGYLPPLVTDGMVIDGSTQPGFAGNPLIIVDGSQMIPEAYAPGTVTGLLIYAANCQVKNLLIQNFNWNGVTLRYAYATNNIVSGCWFGLDYSGTNAAPNALQGILIYDGASGNIVGGTNALTRNVLSGNTQYGVLVSGTNTTGNVILGNYIGTDAGGSLMVSNAFGGVFLAGGTSFNLIGGTNAGVGNVISGNLGNGILIRGSNSVNNTVQGNFIGTDATGMNPLPNTVAGVTVDTGSSSNLIGGTVVGARNVISGNNLNADYGVIIANPGTRGNVVEGNYIGLGADGVTAVPNVFGMVCSDGATSNTFGGTVAGARNVISGNISEGLRLTDAGTMANAVQGNFIGTDLTGENALPNGFAGLTIYAGATSNLIGGTTASARNIISGNQQYGIYISDPGTSNNFVLGNFIGPDVTGTNAIGDGGFGIGIWNSASGNFIGGTSAGAGNLISGNPGFSYGIAMGGVNGNVVQGNFIGTDLAGTNALANGFADVVLEGGSTGNLVGGTGAGARNVIAFSGGYGVVVYDPGTTNNSIRGNSIFSNSYLGIDLNGDGVTPNEPGDADTGPNDLQNFPIITNAFGYAAGTIVSGTLNSAANSTFFIDVYSSSSADPSGYGQGQFYVGTVSVTTGASGNAGFSLTNNTANYSGQYFTATATAASGDTSEFGADVLAIYVSGPSAQFTGPFQSSANGFIFNLSFTTNFSYRIQATTNLGTNPIPWIDLTNFTPAISSFTFTDRTATNFRTRFYRVVSP